jgi:putative transposase
MSRALGEAHRRYTNFINARGRWTGHLFQSRFASVAMDESDLRSAVSYVSLNPVRARLVPRAEEWAWSSVRAHLAGEDDSLVSVRPVLDRWPTFRDLLLEDDEEKFTSLREAECIGRPLGTVDFVTELERRLGRRIARRAPGRKAVAIPVGEQLNLLQ